MRTLRTVDLLVLSIGTFTLGVDGFVLSGLLPQVARPCTSRPAPPASSPRCSPWSTP
jgi:predicted MFS family arabinose efflux permease